MKMKQAFVAALLVAAGIVALAPRAEAIPIVSIVPGSQDAAVDDVVAVDVVVSNLTEPVGGVSLTLSFLDTILEGTSYTIGTALGTGLDFSLGFSGGSGSPFDLF